MGLQQAAIVLNLTCKSSCEPGLLMAPAFSRRSGGWRQGGWGGPRREGFTLLEVMVVIAILGVMVALAAPVVGSARSAAQQSKCLSNQRQIGSALHLYANDHDGEFPPTTHTTGSFRKERSWIFQLADYLEDVDAIRVCPADPPKRQQQILKMGATSYVLNDLVFDDYEFNRLLKIPYPSRTILLFILSESRAPSTTRDHIHGAEWTSWTAALNDIEPDRHRVGSRAPDRMRGSANCLFADGHVESRTARDFKTIFDEGINPASVPTNIAN